MHLKVIQQMSKVPRSVGIPPLSDSSFEQAFTSQTSHAASAAAAVVDPTGALVPIGGGNIIQEGSGVVVMDEDGRINPLAGMGLSDEQYAVILHNLVNGESFPGVAGMTMGMVNDGVVGEKRALDDPSDGRDGKRSRFELVE
jgi:osomolarity two-component system response regulator SKN7